MGFSDAVASGFRNYVNFAWRTPRSGYWYWVLFAIIVAIVTTVVDALIFPGVMTPGGLTPVTAIAWLAMVLPGIAVSVRRLHDLDRSGWWLLLMFVPLIGAIVLLVWFCSRGTLGPNRFGPDPLQAEALSPA